MWLESRKEAGKASTQYPHPLGLSQTPGGSPEVEHNVSLCLGTGFLGFPQELVLGIVINKQQQEAAGSPEFDEYINQAKLGNQSVLQGSQLSEASRSVSNSLRLASLQMDHTAKRTGHEFKRVSCLFVLF